MCWLSCVWLLAGVVYADARNLPDFTVDVANGTLSVRGPVSSDRHREVLRLAAHSGPAAIDYRAEHESVSELPAGWRLLTELAVRAAAQLQAGSLQLSGGEITIDGATSDPASLAAVMRRLAAVGGPDVTLSQRVVAVSADTLSLADSCRRQLASVVAREQIGFSGDDTRLADAAMPVLDRIAELLVDCPELNLTVTGHSDRSGDATANRSLSEARAAAVVNLLVRRGIDRSRLKAVGAGASEPRYAGNDRFSREANRRVEFSFAR